MKASKALVVLMVALLWTSLAYAQTVTVDLWMHEHPPRVPLDEELIARFMEENPDIQVNYTVVPVADFDTRLYTALAAGAGPDLFNQATFALGQFRAADLLAPLNLEAAGYSSVDEVFDTYQVGLDAVAFGEDGRTLYGLPTEVSIYSCYTNDDLWAEAGLDPSTDFPDTWEELVEVADTLTERDAQGNPVQRGFDFNWTSPIFVWLQFNPMVRQLGGSMVTEDYQANIDSPEVQQVMSFWNDFVNVHNLGGPEYTGSRDAFLAGELATECSFGNWGVPQMEEAGINFSIHPAPRWEDAANDTGLDLYGYYFLVNNYSDPEVQEAAWKLAGYLTSFPERYFVEAGLFQPREDFLTSEAYQSDEVMPMFLSEMETSEFSPRIAGFYEVADAVAAARDRIILGGEPIAEVLEQADTEVEAVLERARQQGGQ